MPALVIYSGSVDRKTLSIVLVQKNLEQRSSNLISIYTKNPMKYEDNSPKKGVIKTIWEMTTF